MQASMRMRTNDFCHFRNATAWFMFVVLLTTTHLAKKCHLGTTLQSATSKSIKNIEWQIRKLFLQDKDEGNNDDDENKRKILQEQQQHANAGFVHVGKKREGHHVLHEIASWHCHRQNHTITTTTTTTGEEKRPQHNDDVAIGIRAIRISSEGDIYVQYSRRRKNATHATTNDSATSFDMMPPFRGILADENEQQDDENENATNMLVETEETARMIRRRRRRRRRELVVVGPDQRSRIVDTRAWPYRLIGELKSQPDAMSGNYETCSATIISATSILTSAHCVYNVSTGNFLPVEGFAPARSGNVDPYGIWEYSSMTIYASYAVGLGGDYDIAVVTLKTRGGGASDDGGVLGIGDLVGMAGIVRQTTQKRRRRRTRISPPKLQACTVTGYPLDKPPHEMWTSGSCIGSYIPLGDNDESESESYYGVRYDCDTFSGNSGSALMDSAGNVYGVHWGGTSSYNVGTTLRGNRFWDILQWSGRVNLEQDDEAESSKLSGRMDRCDSVRY
jgi:V8-like Glu-specific endopeptidase